MRWTPCLKFAFRFVVGILTKLYLVSMNGESIDKKLIDP